MRDVITTFAAGALIAAYALVAPTFMAALQSPAPVPQKAFRQHLAQAGGEAPVSAVSETQAQPSVLARGSVLPRFAQH